MISLSQGARITATDHYEAALDFARYNARTNLDLELETCILDWHEPVAQALGSFDLVLAADVLYEGRYVTALSALIPTLLAPGGEILLADPNRKYSPTFLKRMQEKGFHASTEEHAVSPDGREVAILVHRLRR